MPLVLLCPLSFLTSLVNTAKEHGSAAPYLDNSKFYDIENHEIVTHKKIVDIQTPQIYKYGELFECYSFLYKKQYYRYG